MNNKCPVCGSEGKQFTNIPFMYECSTIECGTYFDRKGQRYAREVRGGLIKIREEEDMSKFDELMGKVSRDELLTRLAQAKSQGVIAKELDVNQGLISRLKSKYKITQDDIEAERERLRQLTPVAPAKKIVPESLEEDAADLLIKAKSVLAETFEDKLVRLAQGGATPEEEKELTSNPEPEPVDLTAEAQPAPSPASEIIVDPTPAQVEEFFAEPHQEPKIPAVSGNGRLYLNTDGNCSLTSDFVCMRGTCDGCPIMRDVDKFLSQELSLEPTNTKTVYCLAEEGSDFLDEYKTLDEAAEDIRHYSLDDISRVKLYKEVRTRTEIPFTMEVKVTTK